MNTPLRALTLASACMFSVSTVQAVNLVNNGGFETGDFSGWSTFGAMDNTGIGSSYVHSGDYGAYFGQVGNFGGIYQTLAVVPGEKYKIGYWLRANNYGPSEFKLDWGTSTLIDLVNPAPFGWTEYTHSVVAGGPTAYFGFRQDPSYFYLDDVSVEALPDSSNCFAEAGSVLAALGMFARRNRK